MIMLEDPGENLLLGDPETNISGRVGVVFDYRRLRVVGSYFLLLHKLPICGAKILAVYDELSKMVMWAFERLRQATDCITLFCSFLKSVGGFFVEVSSLLF